jgi:DNA polymerase III subunit epsilon
MLNKILQLTRPLAILDVETTGLNPDVDRIVQIALTMHYPKDKPSIAWSTLVDPEIPIMNTGNHQITDALVAGKPTFKIIAPALAPRMLGIDIGGYNVQFDILFMKAEFKRASVEWNWDGHVIDPLHIYRLRQGHNLQNCYKTYVDPKGFEGSHNAAVDVAATEACLIGQLSLYTDLPRTVRELSSFCFPIPENALEKTGKIIWIGNDAALNFGKWRGRLLKDPEVRSYLYWITNKGDFSDEIKEIASEALEGRYPSK